MFIYQSSREFNDLRGGEAIRPTFAQADAHPHRGIGLEELLQLLTAAFLCRFSDAGDDDLATRSGSRRPKSAKARNRGRYAPWPWRSLSYGGLGGDRAACMPARGERWSDCAGRSMPAGSR